MDSIIEFYGFYKTRYDNCNYLLLLGKKKLTEF